MQFCKLEIFIPANYLETLQTALQKVDAGHIGNYDCCLSYKMTLLFEFLQQVLSFLQ